MRVRTLFIVTAVQRDAANAVAVQVAGPYAADTFSVPCHKGQSKIPTHYAACWSIPLATLNEFRKLMAAQISGKSVSVFEKAGVAKLASEGLNPKAQVSA